MASTKHHIYQFRNSKDEVIYVGIAKDIQKRIKNGHFSGFGHLPEEAYQEVAYIVYGECASKEDADIRERYFINTLAPKYNQKLKNGAAFDFKIPEPEWNYLPVNKSKIGTESKPRRIAHPIPKNLVELDGKSGFLKYVSLDRGGLTSIQPKSRPDYFDFPYVPPFKMNVSKDCVWQPKLTFININSKPMVCAAQLSRLMHSTESYAVNETMNMMKLKPFIDKYVQDSEDLIILKGKEIVEHCLNARSRLSRYSICVGIRGRGWWGYHVYDKKNALKALEKEICCSGESKWIEEELIQNVSTACKSPFFSIDLALAYMEFEFERLIQGSYLYRNAVSEIEKRGSTLVCNKDGVYVSVESNEDLRRNVLRTNSDLQKTKRVQNRLKEMLGQVQDSLG